MLSAAVGILASTSCATTKGFGQDLQKVGSRLED
ncbi:entericidin A/B family lipoprotein, partial [bacterium]|nr:entericidin A/B family lipoprotein [bacterium]